MKSLISLTYFFFCFEIFLETQSARQVVAVLVPIEWFGSVGSSVQTSLYVFHFLVETLRIQQIVVELN
jgi:hypothetical protein